MPPPSHSERTAQREEGSLISQRKSTTGTSQGGKKSSEMSVCPEVMSFIESRENSPKVRGRSGISALQLLFYPDVLYRFLPFSIAV